MQTMTGRRIYRFRLIHPNDQKTSACHTFMVYQNGEFIGEIIGGESSKHRNRRVIFSE